MPPWLPEYLHELAMFPNGKFNDQADSTSQALSFIGAPQPGEAWFETMRQVDLLRHGLRPEDLTVTFDYTDQTARFTLDSGRLVQREVDGFYHVTPGEWETVHGMQGVTKIDDS